VVSSKIWIPQQAERLFLVLDAQLDGFGELVLKHYRDVGQLGHPGVFSEVRGALNNHFRQADLL